MKQNYSEELKLSLVARYRNGESATDVAADAQAPRSTLYSWIKMYQPLKSSVAETISYKEYVTMKRHAQKLAGQLAVLQAAAHEQGCPVIFPYRQTA